MIINHQNALCAFVMCPNISRYTFHLHSLLKRVRKGTIVKSKKIQIKIYDIQSKESFNLLLNNYRYKLDDKK